MDDEEQDDWREYWARSLYLARSIGITERDYWDSHNFATLAAQFELHNEYHQRG